MSLTRPVELLEEAVRLLGQLVAALDTQPLRGVGPEDLLTEEEVARYIHMRRTEARRWLDNDGDGRPRVPRAMSPGRARIPLWRAVDVRRALEEGARHSDTDAWADLGADDSGRRSRKRKGPAAHQDAGPLSTVSLPAPHRLQ